jgi:hypothetical protein
MPLPIVNDLVFGHASIEVGIQALREIDGEDQKRRQGDYDCKIHLSLHEGPPNPTKARTFRKLPRRGSLHATLPPRLLCLSGTTQAQIAVKTPLAQHQFDVRA